MQCLCGNTDTQVDDSCAYVADEMEHSNSIKTTTQPLANEPSSYELDISYNIQVIRNKVN